MVGFWPQKVNPLRAGAPSPAVDFELVRALARAGDLDGAFETLRAMEADGFNAGVRALRYHPMYTALQADPRLLPYLRRSTDADRNR